jgi:hypothetical protein
MATDRTFVDSRGVLWDVVEGIEQNGDASCLRFSSAAEVRELGHVPERWEALGDAELDHLCRRAVIVQGPRPPEHS